MRQYDEHIWAWKRHRLAKMLFGVHLRCFIAGKPSGFNLTPRDSPMEDDQPKICPVTGTYCSSDESDICIDYGCIHKPAKMIRQLGSNEQ